MEDLDKIKPIESYKKIAKTTETIIIRCTEDEVLGLTDVNKVPLAKHIDIRSDHNFSGDARNELISVLREELS